MGGGFHYRCNKIATPNRPARNSASDPAQRAGHGIVQHRAIARDCRAFVVRQVRVPAIENQHGAALVGTIPRLVFDGIVKRKGLPRDSLAGFTAHAKTAVRRNIQRQMHDRARVGNAGMRRNAGVRFQQRKECVGRPARQHGARHRRIYKYFPKRGVRTVKICRYVRAPPDTCHRGVRWPIAWQGRANEKGGPCGPPLCRLDSRSA